MPERLVQLKVDNPTPEYNLEEAKKQMGDNVNPDGSPADGSVDAGERQNTTTEMFLNEQGGVATAASPGGENENTTHGPTDATAEEKAIEGSGFGMSEKQVEGSSTSRPTNSTSSRKSK